MKKQITKKELAYLCLDRLYIGQEFKPFLIQDYIRANHSYVSDGTITRYIRLYRQDTGKKIVCINNKRMLYKYLGD